MALGIDTLAALFSAAVRRRLVVVFLGSLVLALAELVAALLIPLYVGVLLGSPAASERVGWLTDRLGGAPEEMLPQLTVIVVGTFVLKDVFSAGFRYWMLGFIHANEADTAQALLDRYLNGAYEDHVRRSTPEALERLGSSVKQVYSTAVVGTVNIVIDALTIMMMLIALAVVLPSLALSIAGAMVAAIVLLFIITKTGARVAGRAQLDASRDSYRLVLRSLGGFKETALRGTQAQLVDAYGAAARRTGRATQVTTFLSELPRYLLESVFLVAVAVSVLSMAPSDTANAGTLGLLLVAAFRILPSLIRLMGSYASVRGALPAVRDVADELASSPAAPAAPDGTLCAPHDPLPYSRQIELVDVRFRYRTSPDWVLRGISGIVPAGSSIALVGLTGAGKTTLVDVLCGLLPNFEGDILVDGTSIRGREARWRERVAIVPQDPYITEATLSENIVFDIAEEADAERLELVIQQAHLHDLTQGLPLGLDTVLPERGIGLSGGQKQRIAIARALYRGASLLILDEATSALDNETEWHIDRAINALPQPLTVIVIAHRLSTLRSVDNVAVLDGGQIAAFGPAQHVHDTNASFRRWVELGHLTWENA